MEDNWYWRDAVGNPMLLRSERMTETSVHPSEGASAFLSETTPS
jgi:hypothetical protein